MIPRLLLGAPLLLGGIVALLAAMGLLPRPILYLRADLGTLALIAGLGLSALGIGAAVARARRRAADSQARVQAQADAEADRRRFFQRLDHELKNPLMAVRAGLANLADQPAAESAGAIAGIEAQVLRLSRLAADLRKLAELETRPIERDPIDLGELLTELAALAEERPEAQRRHLRLNIPVAPWPLPSVSGDRDLLFLALYNLLDNALKFSRPDDTVELRAFEDGSAVVIAVADTGPGIPDEDQPYIWEELYRSSAARGVPGSGLGMPLVRAIVGRHGGTIALRSRPGQGTVVSVRLPAG